MHCNIYYVIPEFSEDFREPEKAEKFTEEEILDKMLPVADYVEAYEESEETKTKNYIQLKNELIATFGISEITEMTETEGFCITKKGIYDFFEHIKNNVKEILKNNKTIETFIEINRRKIQKEINDQYGTYFLMPGYYGCYIRTKTYFAEELYHYFKANPNKKEIKIKYIEAYDYHC